MARAYSLTDQQDLATEPQPGEWQALRGELVALLDQVEGRFTHAEAPPTAYEGLSQKVRNLRDQVDGTSGSARRREALKTVKRAVDRFSEPEALESGAPSGLHAAIAEIRNRQFSAPEAAIARRSGESPQESPQLREMTALMKGLSGRLGGLEAELKAQRSNNGDVHEVASQVEQLTQVVELLAGAVGETGQVKRLEGQIAGLAKLIGEGSKVDLSAINRRLDDVSATVGKLAELQAEQMEREVVRQERDTLAADFGSEQAADNGQAMAAIETSVRNVYDRIDSIERNVTLSTGEFERLTSEMAAITQAVRDKDVMPAALIDKIDALQNRIDGFDSMNGDVAGLKSDVSALRGTILSGIAPRFDKIETQIEALSSKLDLPREDPGVGQIENQAQGAGRADGRDGDPDSMGLQGSIKPLRPNPNLSRSPISRRWLLWSPIAPSRPPPRTRQPLTALIRTVSMRSNNACPPCSTPRAKTLQNGSPDLRRHWPSAPVMPLQLPEQRRLPHPSRSQNRHRSQSQRGKQPAGTLPAGTQSPRPNNQMTLKRLTRCWRPSRCKGRRMKRLQTPCQTVHLTMGRCATPDSRPPHRLLLKRRGGPIPA
ncbi:hypothetical protein PSQ19_18930 [Devosia algicola]|uniref:Peptidoglycan-binding protein n=1 Tax=Devosia algicola TaxID=3026418 RepID=A0ABY7YN63_9HYPH|nr:hypothetical protein [Devosia algicola]WDR02622.1 hypothetical protein PSQ19_18930 [Devosia algicola]